MGALAPSSTAGDRDRRSDRRYLRSALHEISRNRRVRKCGRYLVDRDQGVGVRIADDVAHFTGLQLCGSIWACPVCSAKIRNERTAEITAAMEQHIDAGGLALFVTLTVQHGVHQRLLETFGLVSSTWRKLHSGRAGKDRRAAGGFVGTIRTLEVTHGDHGWHPHLHALVLVDVDRSEEESLVHGNELVAAWCDAIAAAGHPRPARAAQRVEVVKDAAGVSKYLGKVQDDHSGKMSIAMEMTRSDLKRGRSRSRTPFEVLRDFTETGDMRDVLLWWEYEEVTRGRHAITWSKGLRARFDLEALSDEEITDAEVGGITLAVIPATTWSHVVRHREAGTAILEAAERGGIAGVRLVLEQLGLPVVLGVPAQDIGAPDPPG